MSETPTTGAGVEPGARFDPRVLEALGSTRLRALHVVEGMIVGMHRSPHKGASVEFAEYKEYQPGDDVRSIDWRAYARADRYYVKQYDDETNLRAYLLLDISASMNVAYGAAWTKRAYAATLLAAFAYLLIRQGDAPGLLLFDGQPRTLLPPSTKRSQLEDLCRLADEVEGGPATDIEAALRRIAEASARRSLVVLASDLLDPNEELLTMARVLRRRGMEVVVFHIVDPAEERFPFEGMTTFVGQEGEGELLCEPDDLRSAYVEAFAAHLDAMRTRCRQGDLEYFVSRTDEPVSGPLQQLLQGRTRRRGRR